MGKTPKGASRLRAKTEQTAGPGHDHGRVVAVGSNGHKVEAESEAASPRLDSRMALANDEFSSLCAELIAESRKPEADRLRLLFLVKPVDSSGTDDDDSLDGMLPSAFYSGCEKAVEIRWPTGSGCEARAGICVKKGRAKKGASSESDARLSAYWGLAIKIGAVLVQRAFEGDCGRPTVPWFNWLLCQTDLKRLLLVTNDVGEWRNVPAFSHSIEALRELVKGKPTSRIAIEQSTPSPQRDAQAGAVHSDDFRYVNWHGIEHEFTPQQAAAVRCMWENWERGTPVLGHKTILAAIDHEAPPERLDGIFRDHAAWGTMIVKGRTRGTYRLEGTYRLQPPGA